MTDESTPPEQSPWDKTMDSVLNIPAEMEVTRELLTTLATLSAGGSVDYVETVTAILNSISGLEARIVAVEKLIAPK